VDPEREIERGFSRHLHDIEKTGSMCLDGSPGALYFSKGWGDGKNKVYIHMSGGGWCYGLDKDSVANDCFLRS
jgi:hypothetical protein